MVGGHRYSGSQSHGVLGVLLPHCACTFDMAPDRSKKDITPLIINDLVFILN